MLIFVDHMTAPDVQAVTSPGPAGQNTPVWMELPRPPPARTGAAPAKSSGLSTVGFFALITLLVGAAGIIGVTMWGPEKPTTSRTHLASNPAPPPELPSLPPSAEGPAVPPPAAAAAVSAAPVDSAAGHSAKKAKRVGAPIKKPH